MFLGVRAVIKGGFPLLNPFISLNWGKVTTQKHINYVAKELQLKLVK